MRLNKHRQQVVAFGWQRHALLPEKHHEQYAQCHKQHIGRHEGKAVGTHILLRLAQGLARQVLLHHVLIQSGHHNRDKDTTEKLLPEILLRHPVVHHEHTAMLMVGHGREGLTHRQVERSYHLIYNKEKGRKHTDGLERVRPNQCLDASPAGIEPNQTDHPHHGRGKGNTIGPEDKSLQDNTHHIETHGCTRHLRKQEKPGTGLIGMLPQTPLQIAVDCGQVQAVIDGQQQESHQEVSHDEAQTGLHIGHIGFHHHARHGNEGDARDGGSHHPESHHIPRGATVSTIESFVGCPARRPSAECKQTEEICKKSN